jgi:uncharacterized protein (TIGR02687 family)
MPTPNNEQITDKLNAEFAGDTRKIVFWYDDDAGFDKEIDTMEIVGAKVHRLTPSNHFYTKHLLEREDSASSYLVYAPFPKPNSIGYILEDISLYSRRFYADKPSMLMSDLRIDEKFKPIMKKYAGFFNAKSRINRLYGYQIEDYTIEVIETALMSALCEADTVSFDDVLRTVLANGITEDNIILNDFNKYDLLPAFWNLCKISFGYTEDTPSLLRLSATLLVTYTARQHHENVPEAWKCFVSSKPGNISAFLDILMNHYDYRNHYDELAKQVETALNVKEVYEDMDITFIINCDTFQVFDDLIIDWILGRLHDEDTGAKCAEFNIPSICELRVNLHYRQQYQAHYEMLSSAYEVICKANYTCHERFDDIVKQYKESDYHIDRYYRRFYLAYDDIVDIKGLSELAEKVESIYTNRYLGKLLPSFSNSLDVKKTMSDVNAQLNFFKKYIKPEKNKTAVIISDALRYDIGCELFEKLGTDKNCSPKMTHMYGAIPAYTQLGMAALLPYETLEIKSDGKVIVDGRQSDGTEKREAVLRAAVPNSLCVSYDKIPKKGSDSEGIKIRDTFKGLNVIYVYHNRIDKKGEGFGDDVFSVCTKAIEEIYNLVLHLNKNGNVYNFIITSDHGFLYKREKFDESEKISLKGLCDAFPNRRFIIADKPLIADGVASARLADVIGGDVEKHISWPIGASVFKTQGGLNYVHGGASPQEMLLPLITVKTEKRLVETEDVKIALINTLKKITNLIVHLDFIQKEPISDTVKAVEYKLYFISEDGEKISNEQFFKANREDLEPSKRTVRLKFDFMNKEYDKSKQYALVAIDAETRIEKFSHSVTIDIAFADGIGFGF